MRPLRLSELGEGSPERSFDRTMSRLRNCRWPEVGPCLWQQACCPGVLFCTFTLRRWDVCNLFKCFVAFAVSLIAMAFTLAQLYPNAYTRRPAFIE